MQGQFEVAGGCCLCRYLIHEQKSCSFRRHSIAQESGSRWSTRSVSCSGRVCLSLREYLRELAQEIAVVGKR